MQRFLPGLFVVMVLGYVAYQYASQPDTESDLDPDPDPVPASAEGDAVSVRRVFDGDSFETDTAEVRLLGINAPDRGECLLQDARRALKELLDAGPVVLVQDGADTDRYGRLLRNVQAGGLFVNQELVERGLALVVPGGPDEPPRDQLLAAQERARASGLGMWSPNACGPAASTDVHIVEVSADPPGRDADNLNGEYVVIRNSGPSAVDMTGWKLRDDSTQNRYWFPDGFQLAPQAAVTVHVGAGQDTADDLYWGRRYPVWDNFGDTALLLDPNGNAVSVVDVASRQ